MPNNLGVRAKIVWIFSLRDWVQIRHTSVDKQTSSQPMKQAVSHCASYIALVKDTDLQIHQLLPGSLIRSYNLNLCFRLHKQDNQRPKSNTPVQVGLIQWEIATNDRCTKLAVYAFDLNLHGVLVFDLTEDLPVFIEQDPIGVLALEWIPGVDSEGAYTNCTQICVFSSYGLDARVYSLDCTHVLFTIPKPLYNSIIIRPGDSHIWSVIAAPYYEKNLALRSIMADTGRDYPVIFHLHNQGSISKVLAVLPLNFFPSLSSTFDWSENGKWLKYFDTSLLQYSLKVFNIFALHTIPVGSVTHHTVQATATYDYEKTEAKTNWCSSWISSDNTDYVIAMASDGGLAIPYRTYDISHMTVSQKMLLDLKNVRNVWHYVQDSDRSIAYQRTSGPLISAPPQWHIAFSTGHHFLLASENLIVLVAAKRDLPLTLDVEAIITAPLRFLKTKLLSKDRLLFVFSDHAAIFTSSGIEILATSRYQFSNAYIVESDNGCLTTLVEETPSGVVWRQVRHEFDREENGVMDDSNMEIMRKFQYTEENSKVVNLMKDVQHNEWGQQAKRTLQDPTDTFQTKKRIYSTNKPT